LALDHPPDPAGPTLAERAQHLFKELIEAWRGPVTPDTGLLTVLAQGALTLADHAGSAHQDLQSHMPLTPDYLKRLPHT
ncbi:hypothetical protein KDA82_39110, partial [Streptomyces daliensis]|nr:hypothetical protein [Streptomyces daliensis]